MIGRNPCLIGLAGLRLRQEALGRQVSILGLLVLLQVIIGPADVDPPTNIIFLNFHGRLEVPQRLVEFSVALERMSHVVEQLGIAFVHPQATHED